MKKIYDLLNKYALNNIQDTLAMQMLAPYSQQYLPWSTSSLRPAAIVKTLNEIILHNRSSIIECGGGISTYYIAKTLKERKRGQLYTIEHDSFWVSIVKSFLENESLQDYVSIIYAPLVKYKHSMNNEFWYDTQVIKRNIQSANIDMLLIDGPPAYTSELMFARYPAVPFLRQWLTDDYSIILDDIHRRGEQKILSKWEAMLNIRFSLYKQAGGIAIGRSNTKFTV